MHILVLNAGSSSQKAALYDLDASDASSALSADPPAPLWQAHAEWGEGAAAHLAVKTAAGATDEREIPAGDRHTLVAALLPALWSGPTAVLSGPSEVAAAGHRVVHGGPDYTASVLVTPAVQDDIRRFAAFAPQHNPENLAGIQAVARLLPGVPQVAAFDTAFHATLPAAAAVYPGPYAWYERGIRRYGFHGISHRYCAARAAQLLGRDPAGLRLVTCHLGNGCSLAAIRAGKSIDTTMGFTPLDGLMMGNRPGALDPGILTYLLRADPKPPVGDPATADALDDTLNHASGLLGISGVSSDLRRVLAARAQGHARAALAFDMFVHHLRAYIGAMLAALGGADAIVFAGGIGEHSPEVRAAACDAFAFLGLRLDPARNAAPSADTLISAPDSALSVLIVATQEDWMIARDCLRLLHPT
jgi:acetate kinase